MLSSVAELSQKMTLICCHAYSFCYEAENQYMDCLTIELQTSCSLLEIAAD